MTPATIARRSGRRPNSTSTPRIADRLEELRVLDRWVQPSELLPDGADIARRTLLSADLKVLVEAGVVEHNGQKSRASRYRVVGATPEPTPEEVLVEQRPVERFAPIPVAGQYIDLPSRWQGVVMNRVRKVIGEVVALSPGRRTEPGLLDVVVLSVPQADREVVALVCGELLADDALRLAADGRYWPAPRRAAR
jgi:hypothetical protein